MSTPSTPSQPPQASLLGLPRELRRQIYDIILDQKSNCYISSLSRPRNDEGTPEPQSTYTTERQPPLLMPLAHLARTCSCLSDEIRAHIDALPADKRAATIEISGDQIGLRQCFFQRMPCRVKDLTILHVSLNIGIGDPHHAYPLHECPNRVVREAIITLRQLFHRRRGLLRRAVAVTDVRVWLSVSKWYYSPLSDNGFKELAQEIRFLFDIGLEDSSGGRLFGERNVRLVD